MTQEKLDEVLDKHKAWLNGEPGGERADIIDSDLSGASLSGANLSESDLSGANLHGSDLSRASLSGANLHGSDLSGAILSRANLSGSDLSVANLRGANLSRANLSGAIGLPEAPKVGRLESKILAAIESGGSLEMDAWHVCETKHCRAGWAITLAGEAGRKLEAALGANAAGALIYHASCGYVPDFYATNKDALADIRLRAAKEAV